MDIIKKNSLLSRIVFLLVLMNIGLLAYIRFGPFHSGFGNKKQDLEELSEVLKEKLALSDKQTDSLLRIRTEFFRQEALLEADIREDRDSMNELMFSERPADSALQRFSQLVAAKEGQMEQLRIAQAARIRAQLNSQQLLKLHQLLNEVRDFMKPDDPYGKN